MVSCLFGRSGSHAGTRKRVLNRLFEGGYMTKAEFISGLREALTGNLPLRAVEEQIIYYNQYITEEAEKGKREEEVIQALGDPWVLAQTIIEAEGGGAYQTVYDTDGEPIREEQTRRRNTERHGNKAYDNSEYGNVHLFRLDKWWKKLLLILAVVMVILLVIAVITGLVQLLMPLIIPVIVILLVVRIIESRRN